MAVDLWPRSSIVNQVSTVPGNVGRPSAPTTISPGTGCGSGNGPGGSGFGARNVWTSSTRRPVITSIASKSKLYLSGWNSSP
jgi:hypothetical protein